MDHFTLNLRPKEYFQLAPNMRTAYIELCIYLISNSVTYRPGRYKCFARETIPQTSREILHTCGRRSTGEILYAFGRGRRSTGESVHIYIYICRKVYGML